MPKITLSNFTFSAEEIRDINELIVESVMQAPELQVLHSVYPDILSQKHIGFLGESGLVGVAGQGCDPVPQDWNIPGRQLTWSPRQWEVFLKECSKDLEQSLAVYAMNKGVAKADLTNTDYMAVVVQVLSAAIRKAIWRIVWFSDVDAKNVSNGGIITNGTDVKYFNIINGLWKQIIGGVPSGSIQHIAIDANTGATYADQLNQLTGNMVYDALQTMYFGAPIRLRKESDLIFACTQSFADGYSKYLQGKDLESTYENILEGVAALKFENIPVVPFLVWDELIRSYEDNGTKWNNPHRCILTSRRNLAVGVSSGNVLEEIDVWYDKVSRNNYMYATDSIDALLLSEDHIMLAI